MIPKRPAKHEENVDAWLMTYADMITLLLCFFIIFVSASEPKKDKFKEIAEGVQSTFGAVENTNPFVDVMRALQTAIESKQVYKDVSVKSSITELTMELSTHRFFKDGGADIDEETLPLLDELIEGLKKADLSKHTLVVESHTDDLPPKTEQYPNNWELSSARAAKIVGYMMVKKIPAAKLKAVGFADARPKVPNMDVKGNPIPENRVLNQRVVIRIE